MDQSLSLLTPTPYQSCELCPWRCRVDRTAGEVGKCGAPAGVVVNDYMAHFGEEACLVGEGGSGAVFFSYCTLRCRFCQTYEMSWRGEGTAVSVDKLASIFLWLQDEGCENLNLITPTHFLPDITAALEQARIRGLNLPVVYNSSGFERVQTLRRLEGIVDVYLPDFKFWSEELAEQVCGSRSYPETARAAIAEMRRQVGDLQLDGRGIARRGLIVRHLLLPDRPGETQHILRWITEELSMGTHINLMGHYRPLHRAGEIEGLNRPIGSEEYRAAVDYARKIGLNRLDRTHERLYPLIWRD